MKAFKKIGHFGLWVVHHAITVLTSVLFVFLLALFLFFVFVKTNPRGAEKFILGGLVKAMSLVKVQVIEVKTYIIDDNIQVAISSFTRQTKGVKLSGNGVIIKFSLNDIMHGRLYTINIKEFSVDIITSEGRTKTQNGDKQILTAMYSLIPSVRVEIDDFILNINGSKVHLNSSILILNQGGYIIWVSTKSQEDKYKIHMALNSNVLRVSFSNVPKIFLSNYSTEVLKFIDFDTVSGFMEFNTKNLEEFRYRLAFNGLSLQKSDIFSSNLLLGSVAITGEGGKFGVKIFAPDISFKKNGKISIDATIGKKSQAVTIKLENADVGDVKPFVPWKFIKKTGFNHLTTYLTNALKKGYLQNVLVSVNLPIKKPDDITVKVDFKNTEFEYDDAFASIQNGNGLVDVNTERTIVLLHDGVMAGNNVGLTRVDVNHNTKIVGVDVKLDGSVMQVANVFLPNTNLQQYADFVNAETDARVSLKIDLTCKDVFKCSSFDAIANIKNMISFLQNTKPTTGFLQVHKKKNENIVAELELSDFISQYFTVSGAASELEIDIPKHKFIMKAKVFDRDKTIFDVKSFVFDTQKHEVAMLDIPKISFGQNDFSLLYSGISFKIFGKSFDLPRVHNILAKMKNTDTDAVKQRNVHMDVDIKNMILYNGIQTPLNFALKINNNEIDLAFLDTNLVKFHYFTVNVIDKLTDEDKDDGIFLDIPNLAALSSALSETLSSPIRSGNVSIIGKRDDDGRVVWSGYLRNFHVKMKKFNFNPLKSKINVVYNNHLILFKNLKMRDKNHTVFFTGNINTQSFTTKTKIFYTPSKVEFLNEIPFLKDAFKLTTLGGSKKGLVSLELDATGSIFEPKIKFRKSSSVTSLWKFSFGVVLLPLLLL